MSPVDLASASKSGAGFVSLLARYLSFAWLFEVEPARADPITRMVIRRRNHEVGRRYLPLYLVRYLLLLLGSALVGLGVEAMSAPALLVGACFTLSSLSAVAAMIVGVGLFWMRQQRPQRIGLR